MPKDFAYYFAQLRRIEEHREKDAEKEIRKIYKTILKDTQHWLSDEYVRLAQDGELTYAMLQSKGEYARFLEEVESRLSGVTPQVSAAIRKTVEDVYEAAYQGMVDAVSKAKSDKELTALLEGVKSVDAATIKAVVENPIAGLTLNDTLERNRREIIYDIKRQIGIGLTQGDRQTTMAKRIAKSLDGDYKKAVTIARTEVHRVRETGHLDSCKQINEELASAGLNEQLVKIWRCMKDERTRSSHKQMEGQTVLLNEPFKLPGGVTADSPGNSGVAREDIHCRCFAVYVLMDDSKYFAATGKHFEGYTPDETFSQERKDKAYWFTDKKVADSVLRPETGRVWRNASAKERYAAYEYTCDSDPFNQPLRGFDGSWYNYVGPGNARVPRIVDDLADMISRTEYDFDIWLQRGVSSYEGAIGFLGIDYDMLDESEDVLRKLLIGKEVEDLAFVSTGAAKGQGFSGPLMMYIYAPKGTKMLYCEPFSRFGCGDKDTWDGVSGQNYFGGEFEVLLQRGTRFKITKVRKDFAGTLHVDFEVVSQPK